MPAPAPILIELTNEQIQQLRPFYEHVRTEWEEGAPGMLVAQVGATQHGGHRFMRVGFVPHEVAKTIVSTAK